MPSYARKDTVVDGELGIYHCANRCVRRAFLCVRDPVSGTSYDHRKDWIQDRLEELAGIFVVDILGFAVMANRVHGVVRTGPDVAATSVRRRSGRTLVAAVSQAAGRERSAGRAQTP